MTHIGYALFADKDSLTPLATAYGDQAEIRLAQWLGRITPAQVVCGLWAGGLPDERVSGDLARNAARHCQVLTPRSWLRP